MKSRLIPASVAFVVLAGGATASASAAQDDPMNTATPTPRTTPVSTPTPEGPLTNGRMRPRVTPTPATTAPPANTPTPMPPGTPRPRANPR